MALLSPIRTTEDNNTSRDHLPSFGNRRALALAAVIALAFACYADTLGHYFYSDDFMFLRFGSSHGSMEAARRILTTRVPEINVWLRCYRPLPLLFFIGEFALAGTSPWLYHLVNIICHCLCAALVFLIAEQLTSKLKAPFLAACIFAIYPTHAEVVITPNNLVTGSCSLFFLCSLYFFIRWHAKKSKSPFVLSAAFCCFSLLSKENAFALPPILFVYSTLLFTSASLKARVIHASKTTYPFWLILGCYVLARTIVVGPLVGGYEGALGNWLVELGPSRLICKWPLTCLFPINSESCTTAVDCLLRVILSSAYAGIAVCIIDAFVQKRHRQLAPQLTFLLCWFLAVFATVAPVFLFEDSMAGGRHLYLAVAPVVVAATSLSSYTRFKRLQLACFIIVGAIFFISASLNNAAWAEAGQIIKSFNQAVRHELKKLPENDQLVLVNQPCRHMGVYMFSESEMIKALCDITLGRDARRVRLLSPWHILDHDRINALRLRSLSGLREKHLIIWRDRGLQTLDTSADDSLLDLQLVPLLQHRDQTGQVSSVQFAVDGDTLMQADFLECRFSCATIEGNQQGARPALGLTCQSSDMKGQAPTVLYLPVTADGCEHTYTFRLSGDLRWLLCEHGGGLMMTFPSPYFANRINQVRLLGFKRQFPVLAVDQGRLMINAEKIIGARSVVLEVSYPGALLEDTYPLRLRTELSPHTMFTRHLANVATVGLADGHFRKQGVYQIEALALNSDGKPLGCFSDPLFIQVDTDGSTPHVYGDGN